MASVHDVAAYILQKVGAMSTMKLQKLVYYSQAWHLVWDEKPLFTERIEAWANGPVVYELFDAHRGGFSVEPPWSQGNSEVLSRDEKETVEIIIDSYGSMSARQLSHLTHSEGPWREARKGLEPTQRSNNEITPGALLDFYAALDSDEDAALVGDLVWDDE